MISRFKFISFLFTILFCSILHAQSFKKIAYWEDDINERLEHFLNATQVREDRKVAVFDCDGTLFGQSPYYLADESLLAYAEKNYASKNDEFSKNKMEIIDTLLKGDNEGSDYVRRRINFLSGLSAKDVEEIGENCFEEKYAHKFYPEMQELIANLKVYGFEIWVLTASPEILYQSFVSENLGIPKNRILGVKSVISGNKVTNQIVNPVPQNYGKAEAIQTFIKTKPLFVAGNSRGDMEMMQESIGLKLIVNPDNEKIFDASAGVLNGYNLRSYWEKEGALIVNCEDSPDEKIRFVAKKLKVAPNKDNPAVYSFK
jgi:phosphoserine phosphatase